ncbi:SRPBCC family protein [Mycobacterium sp. ITM-2017-0098]|nr:SRPBCC family protein [Mycobacterium sp. ITM-2017-0098]
MAEVSRSRPISGEPAAVWTLLAEFGAVSRWAGGIDHSCLLNGDDHPEPVGLTRRVQSGRDTFVETITAFEPSRVLAYDISGVPRAFSVTNRWNLEPHADRATTVTLTSTIHMASPLGRAIGERMFARLMGKRSEALLCSLEKALGGNP